MLYVPTIANAKTLIEYSLLVPGVPITRTDTVGSGITNASGSVAGANLTLNWGVANLGPVYLYSYKINSTPASGSYAGGTAYIELSSTVNAGNFSSIFGNFVNPIGAGPTTFTPVGAPDSLYGMSYTPTLNVDFTFTSTIAPAWGNFALSGLDSNSNPIGSYNTNYLTSPDGSTTNFVGWVLVPGNVPVATPEPMTWLILSSLLFLIVLFKKKSIYANGNR